MTLWKMPIFESDLAGRVRHLFVLISASSFFQAGSSFAPFRRPHRTGGGAEGIERKEKSERSTNFRSYWYLARHFFQSLG
jgi:hypothetical protein